MNDNELIGYCDSHSETERALFCREHVERMLKLAGIENKCDLPAFISLKGEMKNLVTRARERSNSFKFIVDD